METIPFMISSYVLCTLCIDIGYYDLWLYKIELYSRLFYVFTSIILNNRVPQFFLFLRDGTFVGGRTSPPTSYISVRKININQKSHISLILVRFLRKSLINFVYNLKLIINRGTILRQD